MNLDLNSHVRGKLQALPWGRPEPSEWPRTQILWDKPYGYALITAGRQASNL